MGTARAPMPARETVADGHKLSGELDHLIFRISKGYTRSLKGYTKQLAVIAEGHWMQYEDAETLLVQRIDDDTLHMIRDLAPEVGESITARLKSLGGSGE